MQPGLTSILDQQRDFFATGATLPLAFRITQLKQLKSLLMTHEAEIANALKRDLNKAPTEAIFNEVLLVIKEINFALKQLHKWMRPKKVRTPFFLWPGRSEIRAEPYGSVLIMGPWNYPFMLIMLPLIGAISAGNCAVVKPSEMATCTEKLIVQLIKDYFTPGFIAAVTGGPDETQQLLREKFDYIFFTGSAAVGKIVMEAAARQLIPVTLELGGKSPCIVDKTADLDFAARRIIWAKTVNAGQTCIAPDYLYVHHSCKQTLIEKLQHAIQQFYSNDPKTSTSYGRIINQKHFSRLARLMQAGKTLSGGDRQEEALYIAPTLIDEITWNDPIMQEEIFGPLLPILTYDHIDEVIRNIKCQHKPLALYLFTRDRDSEKKILEQLSFGGGCVNDCMVQIANIHLPFGGVGQSGMGHYHGQYSFDLFSHHKSIYRKRLPFDARLEYPPYTSKKLWWIRQLLKL
ncbi:aldehyde dehydrogenase [Aquicella lusitana]|uniref:Aldehyde dehydrogenase n=1 Tax=Aquicella lusitana TaxID=254246 RepID=A0A370GMU2_9COXI|nr:aldehyde dehydrogenase [Aquicella lusitana]RDI43744.1 aldehyde dehydrogenase (NAD+) [Aquicella lusitana]VVC74525.1 NAD(P)-dependent benzaldehyde dehydrogenase [Aquicella lusitana]